MGEMNGLLCFFAIKITARKIMMPVFFDFFKNVLFGFQAFTTILYYFSIIS